jgi:RNA polymerase sigma-70 factor (ECF subfamily)
MIERISKSGNRVLISEDFIRRACLRYVQNRDVANDLTQEVLLKIASTGSGFSGTGRATTWVYRVAANHCLDHLRREKRRLAQTERYAAERRLDSISEAGWEKPEVAGSREIDTGRRVLERLSALSDERDRKVIRFRFGLGHSQSDIAAVMGISRPAVGQRLARIRARAVALWREEIRSEAR